MLTPQIMSLFRIQRPRPRRFPFYGQKHVRSIQRDPITGAAHRDPADGALLNTTNAAGTEQQCCCGSGSGSGSGGGTCPCGPGTNFAAHLLVTLSGFDAYIAALGSVCAACSPPLLSGQWQKLNSSHVDGSYCVPAEAGSKCSYHLDLGNQLSISLGVGNCNTLVNYAITIDVILLPFDPFNPAVISDLTVSANGFAVMFQPSGTALFSCGGTATVALDMEDPSGCLAGSTAGTAVVTDGGC